MKLKIRDKEFDIQFTRKNILKYGGISFAVLFLLGLLSVFGLYFAVSAGFFGPIPNKEELKNVKHQQASEVYSADGVLLGRYFKENRINVKIEQVPKDLLDALVATEDARFYEHDGVDNQSLLRVFFKSILMGKKSAGGGSTITQQLAKNLFPRKTHGMLTMPVNKLREMQVAKSLEEIYSKKEILEMYLNKVAFGEDVYGIGVASSRYFSKDPKELTLNESATLVGMLKANTAYNPRLYPERSEQRRNVVLGQMAKYGYLTAEKKDSLQAIPLELNYKRLDHHEGLAPYFREHLRKELDKYFEEHPNAEGKNYNPYTDGLKIYTTIDSRLQDIAQVAVEKRTKSLQKLLRQEMRANSKYWKKTLMDIAKESDRYKKLVEEEDDPAVRRKVMTTRVPMEIYDPLLGEVDTLMSPFDSIIHRLSVLQAGFMAMDPRDGRIMAWVGGIDHRHFPYDHVTSQRQVGSTFKPIVYANALRQEMDPCEYISNERRVYEDYKDWSPRNSGGKYDGFYTMKGGLANSVNTITAEVIMKGGVERTVNLAKEMGITADLPPDPSIGLGTASISLYEMLGAYTVFAHEGEYHKPIFVTKITDAKGNIIYEEKGYSKQVLPEEEADMITEMLRCVVDSGTARRLRYTYKFKDDIAGKTGTTQYNKDGWFIGYTPRLLAGAWVGADDSRVHFKSTRYGQGANTALPIWAYFFHEAKKQKEISLTGYFPEPTLDCPLYVDTIPSENLFERLNINIPPLFKRNESSGDGPDYRRYPKKKYQIKKQPQKRKSNPIFKPRRKKPKQYKKKKKDWRNFGRRG